LAQNEQHALQVAFASENIFDLEPQQHKNDASVENVTKNHSILYNETKYDLFPFNLDLYGNMIESNTIPVLGGNKLNFNNNKKNKKNDEKNEISFSIPALNNTQSKTTNIHEIGLDYPIQPHPDSDLIHFVSNNNNNPDKFKQQQHQHNVPNYNPINNTPVICGEDDEISSPFKSKFDALHNNQNIFTLLNCRELQQKYYKDEDDDHSETSSSSSGY
jgi:hypothetical protein